MDVESDFSAFHRVDDVRSLPAQRFIDWAIRLPAYAGVLAALAAEEQQDGAPTPTGAGSAGSGAQAARRVESTPIALMTDPDLADLGEYSQVERPVDG